MNRSKEACHCRNVTYGMIEAAIRNGADSLQQVMEATGAGKGCGKCKEFLGYLVRDIKEELKNDGPSALAATTLQAHEKSRRRDRMVTPSVLDRYAYSPA